jgi:hypothetical protein
MGEVTGGWTDETVDGNRIQKFHVAGKLVAALGEGLTGTATIGAGDHNIRCEHKLGQVPHVFVFPQQNVAPQRFHVEQKSATIFFIQLNGRAAIMYDFDWIVLP